MSNTNMHIVVKVSIAAESAAEAFALGQTLSALSQKEEGVIYYDFVKSIEETSDEYYIIEKYKDQNAVDFHFATEHFTTLVPTLIEKGVSIKFLKKAEDKCTGARSAPLAIVAAGRKALRMVVSVTVTDEGSFLNLVQQLTEASREEDGCLGYSYAKVLESTDNEYFIIELWVDEAALVVHEESEHYKRLLPQMAECVTINEMLKAFVPVY